MRFHFPAFLLVLASCSGSSDGGPKPQVTGVTGGLLTAADSTIRIGLTAYASRLQPGDTISVRYMRNDSLQFQRRRPAAAVLVDSFAVAAPAYGQTATYTGCGQLERGGRTGAKFPATPLCFTPFTYTRSPAPDPVLDSVVRLVSVTQPLLDSTRAVSAGQIVGPGNQAQTCVFGVTATGRRVKLKNSWNNQQCDRVYWAWLQQVPA